MKELNRLGLGTMGMSIVRNPENSIKTIHAALDKGITLFNTGDFYNSSESELVVGQALKGINHDNYFLSVKFGVLPLPGGGIYGLDVNPFHIKGHLTYSLRRLGLDYIDLYQPARQDTTIPVEEVVGAIAELVKAGYVRHIGLSTVDAETLRRACAVHPIHTVEMEYSLMKRDIEEELIDAAAELGVKVLAYGTMGHGMLSNRTLETGNSQNAAPTGRGPAPGGRGPGGPAPGGRGPGGPNPTEQNIPMIRAVKEIADEKGIELSQLALAWSLSKYDHVQSLVGTTNPDHLQSAIDALNIELSKEDIARIEAAIPPEKISGMGSRNFVFTNGVMTLAE